jgi:hypothetical protein
MGYTEPHLWVDDPGTEPAAQIGEHEGYGTLYDLANSRYLGNHVPWSEALSVFLTTSTGDPEWLRDLLDKRLRVVPRCHCTTEWTGGRLKISETFAGIDFEETEKAVLAVWREHVEAYRALIPGRVLRATKQEGGFLITPDAIAHMDPMERFGAIRAARSALDTVEVDAVIALRIAGRSWTEIAVQLGMTRQSARERFLKHDPAGSEAA